MVYLAILLANYSQQHSTLLSISIIRMHIIIVGLTWLLHFVSKPFELYILTSWIVLGHLTSSRMTYTHIHLFIMLDAFALQIFNWKYPTASGLCFAYVMETVGYLLIEWMALSLKILSNFRNWSKPFRWESFELMRYAFLHNMFGDKDVDKPG